MSRLFRRRRDAVQLKADTEGTSNEITLSVLDATKGELDDEGPGRTPRRKSFGQHQKLGVIRLFTIAGRRRSVATPTKDKEILLAEDLAGEGDGAAERATASPRPTPEGAGKHVRETAPTPAVAVPQPSSGWEVPTALVSARKHRRLRGKRIVAIVCSIIAVVLVTVGVVFAVNYFTQQETLRGRLEMVIDSIDRADESLMKLDELVAAEASTGAAMPETASGDDEGAAATYDELRPSLTEARDRLDHARDEIDEFKPSIGDARDYEVANEAVKAIDARLSMIETGERVMDASMDLRSAQRLAAQGWDALLAADDEAREAATLASDTTQDNARQAIEHSQAAIDALTTSADDIARAQTLAPDVDLAAYSAYINLRIEAMQAAVAADQAYLDRDRNAASEQNARYNELDAQAAAAAETVERNPADLIGASLVERLKADFETYSQQRQVAGNADGLLRTFLDHRT